MNDTFYLTNISPQVGVGFNRHYWSRFEEFCRQLTTVYKDVFVITGPLWLPKQDKSTGKFHVSYEVSCFLFSFLPDLAITDSFLFFFFF